MSQPQPRNTPSIDSREALIFGICDRLFDHGNCVTDVVLVPADEHGEPDWSSANPSNLESLPADEWPEDEKAAQRAAVIVDHVGGCSRESSFLVYLVDDRPMIAQIAGREEDRLIAESVITRDVGLTPTAPPPSRLAESIANLTRDIQKPAEESPMMPELAAIADRFERRHEAANDNEPPEQSPHHAKLVEYLAAFGGPDALVMGEAVYGAMLGHLRGQIRIVDGRGLFVSGGTSRFIDLPQKPKPLSATPFKLGDPTSLPERDWLFARHYIRRYVTASVGPGGGGKTAHSISETLSMVTGRPLLDPDGPLSKPLRVWWINAEDPQDEIDRRFHAAAKHFRVTNEQIDDRLFTDSGRDQQFVIARQEGRDLKIVEPFVADMVREIRRREVDVVIIDPFVSTHEAPENDNGAMQRVAAAWTRVADEANCGIELVHHVAKNQGEITADSARGGGAFKDKVRSMRVFNVMTKDEGERAGVDNHKSYFRVDFGKVNMVASGHSQWRQFVSVPLGNGKGLLKAGDEIGVVEPWRWPSTADAVAGVSAEQLEAIKRKIDGADCRDSVQSPQWAGYKVAEALRMNMANPAEKKEVRRMLDAWKRQGHFTIEQRPDYKGNERPCLVPVFHTSEF